MRNYGFTRVAAIKPEVRIGDIDFNISQILDALDNAASHHVEIALFPELSLTGYTCADLFFQSSLLEKPIQALGKLATKTADLPIAFAVGAPIAVDNAIYNCAVLFKGGKILGIVPKTYLPNYNEFYEKRWFAAGVRSDKRISLLGNEIPFSTELIFNLSGVNVGIELCEDLWVPIPPSCTMAKAGADIILNLSATDEQAGKHAYLVNLIKQQSARCRCAYIYASAGTGESSTDLAFSGNCIIAENGSILAESERFSLDSQTCIADIDVELLRNDHLKFNSFGNGMLSELTTIYDNSSNLTEDTNYDPIEYRYMDPYPFIDGNKERLRERCDEISSIQAWGLVQRLKAIHCKNAIIGISGGLDSTLALLVTVKAFDMLGLDRKGICGVTMPGFGTTVRTKGNAWSLMEQLGITCMEISINNAVEIHFGDIEHNPEIKDATYENSQARERTQILMDLANQRGGIVIGTGDLSELALGWCTYNGDQMSMYGVNTSIPKTLVKDLVRGYILSTDNDEIKKTLADIIDTPISPELLPADENGTIAQKTEDLVGPYELHDFFLHAMLRHSFSPTKIFLLANKAFASVYDSETIKHWLKTFYRRFFNQQFKRSCMPDGVKVGSVCLSPRGDWRMPSDASVNLWLNELENID